MTIEFVVYSRRNIEAASPCDVPHVFISITTPDDVLAKLPENENTRGVLRLAFDDADRMVPILPWSVSAEDRSCILFDDAMASAVVRFVKEVGFRAKAYRYLIHCDAGRSRSAAVAAALSQILNEDDKEFFDKTKYSPNMLVYRKILTAWFGNPYDQ